MNTTTTGIAVALAVAVVAIFFIVPSLSPFNLNPQPAAGEQGTDLSIASTTQGQAATSTTSSNTNTMTTPDGLQITDEVVGTGPVLAAGDTVQIKYTGMLTNGTVFDSSDAHGGTPLTLIVGNDGSLQTPDGGGLIEGWSKGVVGMKAGGKRKLVIPAALGYGAQAVGNIIPANSTLVFELELVSVQGK